LQTYGAQEIAVGLTHAPAPSQRDSGVTLLVLALQLLAAQLTPAAYFWQPPIPSHLPLVPQVEAACVTQMPCGSALLAGTDVQVPLPLKLQATQPPVQAVAQQTLSTQWPEPQSASALQAAPLALGPHEPGIVLVSQLFGGEHCVASLQEPKQAVRSGLQTYGAQEIAVGVTHAPAPSQCDSGVTLLVLALQLLAAQVTPAAYFWQPPIPSHLPLVPQVEVACVAQMPCGSGLLAGTDVQVPLPLKLQATHPPLQAVAQHTLSTQWPEPHSASEVHAVPLTLGPHEPGIVVVLQLFGGTHCVASLQEP